MGIGVNVRPTLVDLRKVGEYATLFRWNLNFPLSGLPIVFERGAGEVDIIPRGHSEWRNDITNSISAKSGFFKMVNVLCESAGLPSKTIEKMPVTLRGHTFFQPGIVTPASEITLNFVENTNNIVHHFFYAWQEAIWAMNLGIGVPYDDLVADRIELIRLDNADQPICVYNLRFCFLKSYSPGNLVGDASGPLAPSVVLSYDDFYVSGTNINDLYGTNQLGYSTLTA